MKLLTKFSHTIVRKFSFENGIIYLARRFGFFRKLLPLPFEYHNADLVRVQRNGINLEINRSDFMQWKVYAGFDEPVYEFLGKYLHDDGLVLDVGANMGAFSLNIARNQSKKNGKDVRVLAFEPNPGMAEIFQKNLQLNPAIIPLIEVHQLACGAKNGDTHLVFDPSNSGGGKINSTEGESVKIVRLDDFLTDEDLKQVKVLKIDVEGFEPEVLKGAAEIIRWSHPLIYLEVTDAWYKNHGSSAKEVIDSLRNLNYDLFCEQEDGFKKFTSIPDDFQFNLLCVPK